MGAIPPRCSASSRQPSQFSRRRAIAISRQTLSTFRGRLSAWQGDRTRRSPCSQEVLVRQQAVHDRAGETETLSALAAAGAVLGLAAEARSRAEAAVNLVEELRTGSSASICEPLSWRRGGTRIRS